MPFEEICRIGENVAAFSSQVTDMQRNVIESSKKSGSRVTSSPGAMQPNTVSPHLTNKNTEMCKPFSLYKDDTVTSEMKEGLYSFWRVLGTHSRPLELKVLEMCSSMVTTATGILEESTKRSQSRK